MPPAVVDQIATYVRSLQPVPSPVAQGSEDDEESATSASGKIKKKARPTGKKSKRVRKVFR